MKKFFIFLNLFVFITVLALPIESYAQSSGRRERSSLRRKINKLDDDRVANVPVPILFGVTPDNITSDFGDPRGGGARKHEGQDIMAPRGAPIVTPTEAVVIREGYGDSSGNYVYTANPGGETFAYMHLDKPSDLDEGDELSKGDLIGYIGNTGNASGGVTHLHFEIHDDDGDPQDPYKRLQSIFPIADKIKYVEEILNNADDQKKLAEFIVTMYRKELYLAKSLNIVLPDAIEAALPTASFVPPVTTSLGNSNLDLRLGSRGAAVVNLQKFLLTKNAGVNNRIVADGVFGLMTERALIDYQSSAGINPANGYYGPITRAYISSHP
jgi:hypothetical protein